MICYMEMQGAVRDQWTYVERQLKRIYNRPRQMWDEKIEKHKKKIFLLPIEPNFWMSCLIYLWEVYLRLSITINVMTLLLDMVLDHHHNQYRLSSGLRFGLKSEMLLQITYPIKKPLCLALELQLPFKAPLGRKFTLTVREQSECWFDNTVKFDITVTKT